MPPSVLSPCWPTQTQAHHGGPRFGYQSHRSNSAKQSASSSTQYEQSRPQTVCRHSMRCSIHALRTCPAKRDSRSWLAECCARRWNNSVLDRQETPRSRLQPTVRAKTATIDRGQHGGAQRLYRPKPSQKALPDADCPETGLESRIRLLARCLSTSLGECCCIREASRIGNDKGRYHSFRRAFPQRGEYAPHFPEADFWPAGMNGPSRQPSMLLFFRIGH